MQIRKLRRSQGIVFTLGIFPIAAGGQTPIIEEEIRTFRHESIDLREPELVIDTLSRILRNRFNLLRSGTLLDIELDSVIRCDLFLQYHWSQYYARMTCRIPSFMRVDTARDVQFLDGLVGLSHRDLLWPQIH